MENPAGNILRVSVILEVMKWTKEKKRWFDPKNGAYRNDRFNPQEDMRDAFEVIERMREFINDDPNIWDAFIEELGFDSMRDLMANISPVAICRASLVAVRVGKDE